MALQFTPEEDQKRMDEYRDVVESERAPQSREVRQANTLTKAQAQFARGERPEPQGLPSGPEEEEPVRIHIADDITQRVSWREAETETTT